MNRPALLFALLIALAPLAASAKGPEERIVALEQQLTALQRTYTANNADTASAVERVRTMQDDFNSVKGQAEAASQMIRSQHDELMRLIQDLQQRIGALEERMGVASTGTTPAAAGKVPLQSGAEAEHYQRALGLAQSGNYLEAAGELEDFLKKYPKSPFASNARSWVAECFYMSRDYKRAIKEFQLFIEKYPKDPKVPEAILKQGNAFYELGMLEEARAFYDKVLQSSPKSQAASQARAKLNRIDERKSAGGGAGSSSPVEASRPTAESPSPAGAFGGYPTETVEQQRAKIGSSSPPPASPTASGAPKAFRPTKEF